MRSFFSLNTIIPIPSVWNNCSCSRPRFLFSSRHTTNKRIVILKLHRSCSNAPGTERKSTEFEQEVGRHRLDVAMVLRSVMQAGLVRFDAHERGLIPCCDGYTNNTTMNILTFREVVHHLLFVPCKRHMHTCGLKEIDSTIFLLFINQSLPGTCGISLYIHDAVQTFLVLLFCSTTAAVRLPCPAKFNVHR